MLAWIIKPLLFRFQIAQRPRARFLAATALSVLKPRFKKVLRPVAGWLVRAGVTANQVTVFSLAGSIAVGAALAAEGGAHPALFGVLPLWLLFRMVLATLDGTMAHDFGQKSRLGGILNEAGDVISDMALYMPLALMAPFSPKGVAIVMVLAVEAEIVGIAVERLGGGRRVEGPMGKADRSIVFGTIGAWLALVGTLPAAMAWVMPILAVLLVLTIANRLRFASV